MRRWDINRTITFIQQKPVTPDKSKTVYVSGKNIVHVREHFSENNTTLTTLVENTIRYDSRNSA